MRELEAAAGVAAEPTTFWAYLSRFAIPALWFLSGLAFVFTLSPYRLLPDIFLLAFIILWIRKPHLRKARMLAVAFSAFLLVEAYLPFDISMVYWPGKPRVVQLIMGRPNRETTQRAERREVALGGCIVMGNEPSWILIW